MVMTMMRSVIGESSGITSTGQPWNRLPLRANVMIVVDCRTARPIVR